MKNNNKDKHKNEYYIFRVEPINEYRVKKIKMTTFFAKSEDEAYNKLKDYRSHANKAYTYYFGNANKYISTDKNGKKHYFNDFFDMMEDNRRRHQGLWNKMRSIPCIWRMRWSDFKYKIKNIFYFIKHGHGIGEDWDIFQHILDDIEFNIPKIIDEITVPQYFEILGYKKIHGDTSATKRFVSDSRRLFEGDEPEYKIAKEMWNNELNKFLEDIRLYNYYRSFGVIDNNDEKYAKIKNKYEKTLPYLKGRYKEFDYDKLVSLRNKQKNRIMDFLRKYGEELSD